MPDNEYKLLQDACLHVAELHPKLQNIQHESATQMATGIQEEIEQFLGAIFHDREQTRESALQSMQPLLSVFDLALLQMCDLAHFAWRNIDSRTKLIWPDTPLPKRPSPTRTLYLQVSNLAQQLQAVRLLLLSGFEGQSRAMVRAFIELADVTLATLADETVYRNYITTYEDEQKTLQHWRKHLSPGVIRQRLVKLDEELAVKDITNITPAEVREETYRWFSLFSHVNMAAHLVSAYPTSLDDQRMRPTAAYTYSA
jgi:hypothetical protein